MTAAFKSTLNVLREQAVTDKTNVVTCAYAVGVPAVVDARTVDARVVLICHSFAHRSLVASPYFAGNNRSVDSTVRIDSRPGVPPHRVTSPVTV
jgi:hypothetical protein